MSPHASSFKLKFTVSKTSNSTEFSSKCLLEIRPADLLDTLLTVSYFRDFSSEFPRNRSPDHFSAVLPSCLKLKKFNKIK